MKIVKIIIVIICAVILIYIGLQFFVLDKQMIINYDFSKNSDRISRLMPWYRLMPIDRKVEDPYQAVKDSLVYFNAELPPNFDECEVVVKYKGNTAMRIGAEKSRDKYEFVETELDLQNGWYSAKANFNLREVFLSNYFIENNKLKFALSAPGISDRNMMEVTDIKVDLKKSDLEKRDWQNMYARIKNKLF